MTSGSNEQDLIFRAKFEDEASEDIQNLNEDLEDTNKSMGGLGLGAVTAGLAMFGLGVGVKQVAGAIQETTERVGQVDAKLALLPSHVRTAMEDMDFTQLASDVAATQLEIEEAFAGIASASGGIIPAIDEVKLAFDLARTTGVDLSTATDIVGQALMGNFGPLNELLDGSGKNFISVNKAMEDLGPIADGMVTPIDHMSARIRHAVQNATDLNGNLDTLFGRDADDATIDVDASLLEKALDLTKEFFGFWDRPSTFEDWKKDQEKEADREAMLEEAYERGELDEHSVVDKAILNTLDALVDKDKGLNLGPKIEDWVGDTVRDLSNQVGTGSGAFSSLGPAAPPPDYPGAGAAAAGAFFTGGTQRSTNITINGVVDASTIARQIDMQLRNIYRGGINTLSDSRMFPS